MTAFPGWLIGELKANRMSRVEEHLSQMPQDRRQVLLDEALVDAHKRGLARVLKPLVALGAQLQLILGPRWVVGQLEAGFALDEQLPPMTPEERQTLLDQSLLEAANKKLVDAAKALVTLGAKLSVRDKKGRHALGIAVLRWIESRSHRNGELARALTYASQDPDDRIAGAPLIAWDCTDAEWLLANGADPNASNDAGQPVIHLAAGNRMRLELLKGAGASMFAVDRDGRTLLHAELAKGFASTDLVELLLELGLDREDPSWFMAANSCNNRSWRPHMQAMLLDHGFPLPQSLNTGDYRLDDAAPGETRDRMVAECSKALLDGGTRRIAVKKPPGGECPRCGRAAHHGRCRL